MAEVVLFHSALGLTPGVRAFADDLRAAGHTVHTPDLYGGQTFDDLEEGVAHAMNDLGPSVVVELGESAVAELPTELVYVGMSLGAMPAQALAMTRPGARGAVLLHSAVPLEYFGDGTWPDDVPVQLHLMEGDNAEGDVDVARELADAVPTADLFLYPGDAHLFTDRYLPDYDPQAADAVLRRVLALLDAG